MRKENFIKTSMLLFGLNFSFDLWAAVLIERYCHIPDYDSASTYCTEKEFDVPGMVSAAHSTKNAVQKAAAQNSASKDQSSAAAGTKNHKMSRDEYCAELKEMTDRLEIERKEVQSSIVKPIAIKPDKQQLPLVTHQFPPPAVFTTTSVGLLPLPAHFQPPYYSRWYGWHTHGQRQAQAYYSSSAPAPTFDTGNRQGAEAPSAASVSGNKLESLTRTIDSLTLTIAQECEEINESGDTAEGSAGKSHSQEVPLDMHVHRAGQITTICSHYLRSKPCPRGRNCLFSHSMTELRRKNPKYKTQYCINEKKPEGCRYNVKCRFLHKGEYELIQKILKKEAQR